MKKLPGLYIIITGLLLFVGCRKDDVKREVIPENNTSFSWKENLSVSDIPDFDLKGNLDGKEVRFPYVVFEKWRGSNDNVLNFSIVKAEQQCGYIENYQGFQLINKGHPIEKGEFVKEKFTDDARTFQSFFRYIDKDGASFRSDAAWNCALKIESASEKTVSGKVAICFNDEEKSWLAGKFEAVVCNN